MATVTPDGNGNGAKPPTFRVPGLLLVWMRTAAQHDAIVVVVEELVLVVVELLVLVEVEVVVDVEDEVVVVAGVTAVMLDLQLPMSVSICALVACPQLPALS